MQILLLTREVGVLDAVRADGSARRFMVDLCSDLERTWGLIEERTYNVVVLDLRMPGLRAADFRQRLAQTRPELPVLLVAQPEVIATCALSLAYGINDYILAPFSARDLIIRLKVLAYRPEPQGDAWTKVGDLSLNRLEQRARRAGRTILLTRTESILLEYLMQNAGHPVTRSMITEHIWHAPVDKKSNKIEVYINYLRRKLGDRHPNQLIRTAPGVGYELLSDGASGNHSSSEKLNTRSAKNELFLSAAIDEIEPRV